MYQYRYETVSVKVTMTKHILLEHRGVIDNLASEGWRFVAAIPTVNKGYGMTSDYDLVFEKEINE